MSLDMFPDSAIEYLLENEGKTMSEKCSNCGKEVNIAIFKGTGLCSENCRKEMLGEESIPRTQTDAGVTAMIRGGQNKAVDPRGIV